MSFTIQHKYDSLTKLLKQLKSKPYNKLLDRRASQQINFEFTQTENFEEAISIAESGWKKGKDIISKLTKEHENSFIKLFPKQDFDIQLQPSESGEIVNVNAAIQNLPESMFHFYQDEEKLKKLQCGKMQRIIVCIACSANIDSDTIFNRGAIISSMINIMELYGFRTELWIYHGAISFNRIDTIEHFTKIKSFDKDLDLGLLAFTTTHPSYLRRLIFALDEQENDEVIKSICKMGYGYPINLSDNKIKNFGGDLVYGNIYFEKLDYNKKFVDLLKDTKTKIEEHFTKIKI